MQRGACFTGVRWRRVLARLSSALILLAFLVLALGLFAGRAEAADWILNITDGGFDPIPAGGTIEYQITARRSAGSGPAVFLLDVPAGTRFSELTSATIANCLPRPATGPAIVACEVPPTLPGTQHQAVARFKALTAGVVVTRVAVEPSAPPAGEWPENATSQETTIKQGADLQLSVTAPAEAAAGGKGTYTFTVRNDGPDDAESVVLTLASPVGLGNITAPAGCVFNSAAASYVCTLASPPRVGQSVQLSFSGQFTAGAGSEIAVLASIEGIRPLDPDSANNTAATKTTLTAGSDLAITKTRSPAKSSLVVGDEVSFTLRPSYAGDDPRNIVVTDSLPPNYSYDDPPPAGEGWSCGTAGAVLTCTRTAGLGEGTKVLPPIVINAVAETPGTSIRNEARIASDTPDPDTANNAANDGGATINQPQELIGANKTGPSPAVVTMGKDYKFAISATNRGNQDFAGTLTMTDSIPAGLSIRSLAPLSGGLYNGWRCGATASDGVTPAALPVSAPDLIVCSREYTAANPLKVGATTPGVELTARIRDDLDPPPTSISNCMTVTGARQPNTKCYGVTPKPLAASADVAVTKTVVSPGSAVVRAGDEITFEIKIANRRIADVADTAATNVTVRDVLSSLVNNADLGPNSGVTGIVATTGDASGLKCGLTADKPSGAPTRVLSCTIDSLPVCDDGVNGGEACPRVRVTVRPGGNPTRRTNVATASSSTVADPDPTNNSGSASYRLSPAFELGVTKIGSPTEPRAGENLTYTITVVNKAGRSDAQKVIVTDQLPANVTFVSASPGCTRTGMAVRCDVSPLASGTQKAVSIVVSPNYVPPPDEFSRRVENRATAAGEYRQTVSGVEEVFDTTASATALNDVLPPSLDLLVNKSDSSPWGPDPVLMGEEMVYGITVTNAGPSAATGVVVTDTLPAEKLRFAGVKSPSDVSCSPDVPASGPGGTVTCRLDRLAPDENRVIEIRMRALDVATGPAVNKVTVASNETADHDSQQANNTTTQQSTVVAPVDLSIVKSADRADQTSREFDFTLSIRNNKVGGFGDVFPADLVQVSDDLPAGMELTGRPSARNGSTPLAADACSGADGGTYFQCALGTVRGDDLIEIRVPVRLLQPASASVSLTNTATVGTKSALVREVDTANNSSSATVALASIPLSGTVFVDFDQDGVQDAEDYGVEGVSIALSRVPASGGAISFPGAITGKDGAYQFLVPPGTYRITRGAPPDGLAPGQALVGKTDGHPNGNANGNAETADIAIAASTKLAERYDFSLHLEPGLALTKSVVSGPTLNSAGNFDVAFKVVLANNSSEPLAGISLTDPLEGAPPLFGAQAVPPARPGTYAVASQPAGSCGGLSGQFTGAAGGEVLAEGFTLGPGESCDVAFTLELNPHNPLPPDEDGRYRNTAKVTAKGQYSGKDVSSDASAAVSPAAARLGIDKQFVSYADEDGNGFVSLGDVLNYTIVVTNTGAVTLTEVRARDDKVASAELRCGRLEPGGSCSFTVAYAVTVADVQAGRVVNTATAESNEAPPVSDSETVPVLAVIDGNTITKEALVSTVKRGERVPYVIKVQDVPFNPARIVDVMPPGFSYVAGTSSANGVKVEPAVESRNLTYDGLTSDKGGDITLKLTLVANTAAKPGRAVNVAQLVDPSNGKVIASARASVTILEEAVFDCTDIIGKVFDDRNRSGYQEEGEPGLAGVRLATVHGLLVTSDPQGRFSIPCADAPDAQIGSNFILKLDTRTLPAGYRVTTENPRRVRLTRGKMAKVNFGAAITRLVQLDLNAAAFQKGSERLNPKWEAGLPKLIETLEAAPSALRITYQGRDDELAKARLDALRREIERLWRERAEREALSIETRILAKGDAP